MYRQAVYDEKLIFEQQGERSIKFKKEGGTVELPEIFKRANLNLPDHSEIDVIRHYTRLSQMNYAVDLGIYP
ncbi:MAG: aminomethyl-transferring glycine dehydrogenase subunit GcvPB, partial [Thermoplasmata archaeon]